MTYCPKRRRRRAKIKEKNVDFATEMPNHLLPLLKTRFEDVGFCNWGKQRSVGKGGREREREVERSGEK